MECFAVSSSVMNGRYDPLYQLHKDEIEKPNTKFKLSDLRSLLLHNPQYGANLPAIEGDPNNDFRYVRITDIDEYGELIDDDWKTAKIIEPKYILNQNDILFARSGATAGKSFLYKKEYGKAIFAGYLIRFIFDEKKIDPKYIFYNTKLNRYNLWVKVIQRPSGQPNINSNEFAEFTIPLPGKDIEKKIVQIMDDAYKEKVEKELKARFLLESIYDYLITELNLKFTSKAKTAFKIDFQDMGVRLDPLYHYEDIYTFLKNCKFSDEPLDNVVEYFKTGFAAGKSDQDLTGSGVIQIRPTNLSNNRKLIFEKNIYIDNNKLITQPDDILVKGEVLFNNTNSQEQVGKTVYFNIEGSYFCSNHITRLNPKKDINPIYLTTLLNLYQKKKIFYRICTNWNNQSGVNINLLNTVKIPVPSKKIQDKIADHITSLTTKTNKLRDESIKCVEGAKAKVEKIILNE